MYQHVRAFLAFGVVAIAVPATAHGASDHPANVPWERFLPALPSSSETQPGSVPRCRKARPRCIRVQIRRMRARQERWGCDHRAVFTTTYLELTRTIRRVVRRQPGFYRYPRYLFRQTALFANVYFRTIRDHRLGRPIPEAWRIAFEAAQSRDLNATQDMLLGINAHVQHDMPFVVAALGLRTRSGASRKEDHDVGNDVLDQGYGPVVQAVRDRFDPQVSLTNPDWAPHDDVMGLELVKTWREAVWRNAERLVNARSGAERRRVAQEIEDHAAGWARGIAAVEQPGYRAVRDAYCRERLGAAAR